jgi:hypothetical protein
MVTLDAGGDNEITLDAALSEKRSRRVTLTKHPVEEGVKPSDHAELEPDTYSVEGIISGVPLSTQDQQDRGLADGQALDGSFVKSAMDTLDRILDARSAVTVTTELKRYDNMVMTSLEMPRDAEIGEAIHFTATFEQIRFVQTQTVRLQPPKTGAPQKVTGHDKQGKKAAAKASDEEASWAESGLEALGADPNKARVPQ